jgi:DNA-binding NarL/FixJ family response regulator
MSILDNTRPILGVAAVFDSCETAAPLPRCDAEARTRGAIRIAVADCRFTIPDRLERVFRGQSEFDVIARCTNVAELIKCITLFEPDVALLDVGDISWPDLELSALFQAARFTSNLILITTPTNEAALADTIAHGSKGIVPTDAGADVLLRCVRTVYAGGVWFKPNRDTLCRGNTCAA